jgi:hypothetical protein
MKSTTKLDVSVIYEAQYTIGRVSQLMKRYAKCGVEELTSMDDDMMKILMELLMEALSTLTATSR